MMDQEHQQLQLHHFRDQLGSTLGYLSAMHTNKYYKKQNKNQNHPNKESVNWHGHLAKPKGQGQIQSAII